MKNGCPVKQIGWIEKNWANLLRIWLTSSWKSRIQGIMIESLNMEFYRPNNLISNVVLVNGTARCGKSLVSPIISTFDRVEIERIEGAFDFVSVSYYFDKINKDCAISLLRSFADEYGYEGYLSRNTNFRWSDHSSVFKSPNWKKYIRRLFEKEGEQTVVRIRDEQPIFQNLGHDQMRFVRLLLDAWPTTFRMIEIVRDPIDQIDAWSRRDWGRRFCVDPMALTPCIKFNDKAVPFYAHGWEQEYLEAAPMDRIIKMLYTLQLANREAYEKLNDKDKQQIKVIRFEDFVSDTYNYVEQLASFLKTTTTKSTKSAIHKQGCPRYQPPEKRTKRFETIKQEATSPYLELVNEMIEDYSSDWI